MVSRLRSYSYLLMLAVGLSGCTSWFADDTPPPQIHLVKVELVRAKLLEQKFKLHFRVDNRGDSDLTVRGLIYKISLADVELTEGESNEWLTIAPHGRGFFQSHGAHQPVAAGARNRRPVEKPGPAHPLSPGR